MELTLQELNDITYPLVQKIINLEEDIKIMKDCLTEIANTDFRGNRPAESVIAYQCLQSIKDKYAENNINL